MDLFFAGADGLRKSGPPGISVAFQSIGGMISPYEAARTFKDPRKQRRNQRVNEKPADWPWPDLVLSKATVRESHLRAFVKAKELLLRRSWRRPDKESRRALHFKRKPPVPAVAPLRLAFKAWLDIPQWKFEI